MATRGPYEPLLCLDVAFMKLLEALKDSRKIKVAKKEAWVTGMSAISRSDGSTRPVDTKIA